DASATAAFFYETGAEWTVGYGQVVGGQNEVIYNELADQFVFVPIADNWDGGYVLPLLVAQPFTIVRRDIATGWVLGAYPYDPISVSDNDFNSIAFQGEFAPAPPLLTSASPFDLIRFRKPPEGIALRLRMEIEAVSTSTGAVHVRSVDGFPLPSGSHVSLFDLTPAIPTDPEVAPVSPIRGPTVDICGGNGAGWTSGDFHTGDSADEFLVVVTGEVDPLKPGPFVLRFDRKLSESTEDLEPSAIATLTDLGPTGDCSVGGETEVPLTVTMVGGDSLVLMPPGSLTAGHRFRLRLKPAGIASDNFGQGIRFYWPEAPSDFFFATRPVSAAPVGTMVEATQGTVRDLLQIGNLVMLGTDAGELLAVDTTVLDEADATGAYEIHAALESSATRIRALASDGHNRVYFNGQFGVRWGVKTVPVENVREAQDGLFTAATGGVTIANALGASASGWTVSEWLGLGAMPIGTPVDMEVLVHDLSIPPQGDLSVREFYKALAQEEFPDSLTPDAEGIYTFNLTVPSSLSVLTTRAAEWRSVTCSDEEVYDHFDRVTIDNLTTGQSWSYDVENSWLGGGGTGERTVQLRARESDRLRIRFNTRAFAYVAIVGSGIAVVDLNRFYHVPLPPAGLPGGGQCGRRLGNYQGEEISFPACTTPNQLGIASTPSVAMNFEFSPQCSEVPPGGEVPPSCVGRISTYSPLMNVGLVSSSSNAHEPGRLGQGEITDCIRTVDGRPVFLRDLAISTGVPWVDRGIRGTFDGAFSVEDQDKWDRPVLVEGGDLLFVSLGDAGVFVFDITKRVVDGSTLVGRLYAPGHPVFRLQVDDERGLLFAGGWGPEGPVIDVWNIQTVNGAPGLGFAPVPVMTLNAPWTTNHLGLDKTGAGLLFTWDHATGVTALPVTTPEFAFSGFYAPPTPEPPTEGADSTPELINTSSFLPLGIPMERTVSKEEENKEENEETATAAFKVRLALPGSFGEQLTAKVQSLRVLPDGRFLGEGDIGAAVAVPGGPGWPAPEIEVTLHRVGTGDNETPPASGDPFPDPADLVNGESGRFSNAYNLYESEEVVLLIADPRASKGYIRQDLTSGDFADVADEKAQCRRCEWPSYLPDPAPTPPDDPELARAKELLAGGPFIRVFLSTDDPESPTGRALAFFESQGDNYRLPSGAAGVIGWADGVPSPIQVSLAEPARNPAVWSPSEAGLTVSLVSGETIVTATDHAVAGRGSAFSVDRTYRSGVIGYGPLGSAGWDASFFAHVRENKLTGEVELRDGQGGVWRFLLPSRIDPVCPDGYTSSSNAEAYCTADGVDLRLDPLLGGGWRLIGRQHEVLTFDENGRLTEMRDRLRRNEADPAKRGNTLRLTHDAFGQLIQVKDDLGRAYEFEYESDVQSPSYGLLRRIRDFAGNEVEYVYHDDRRLHRVILPDVSNPVYPPGSGGQELEHEDPTIEYRYTGQQFGIDVPAHGEHFSKLRLTGYRLPEHLGPDQPDRLEISYTSEARVEAVTFPTDVSWQLSWDPAGSAEPTEALSLTAPWGQVVDYLLADGRTTSIVERSSEVLFPGDDAPADHDLTTEFVYTDDGRLTDMRRPDGSEVEYRYPEEGDRLSLANVISVVEKAGGAPTGGGGAKSYQETVVSFVFGGNGGVDNIPDGMTDAVGRAASLAVPGETLEGLTSGIGALTVTTDFDEHGRVASRRVGGSEPGSAGLVVDFSFDDDGEGNTGRGLVTKVEVGGEGGLSEDFSYDASGNVEREETSYGTSNEYTYDEWARPIQEVVGKSNGAYRAVNATVQRAFDAAGHLIRERQLISEVGWVETRYEYNAREQLVSTTQTHLAPADAGGTGLAEGVTTTTYDEFGRVKAVTSAAGVTTTYSYYSHSGRLKNLKTGSSGEKALGYDANGRIVYTTDGEDGVWRGTYDGWGRLYQELLPSGALVDREFSKAGELLRESVFSDEAKSERLAETRFTWNDFGEVETITEVVDEVDGAEQVLVTKRTYDDAGRVTEVSQGATAEDGRVEQTISYEDGTGRVSTVSDAAGNVVEYLYDNGSPWPDRLVTSEVGPQSSGDGLQIITELEYDALGRVVAQTTGGTRIERTVDEQGSTLAVTKGATGTIRYRYDGQGKLLSELSSGSGRLTEYGYDSDGNPLEMRVHREEGPADVASFTYDDAGRLETLTRPGLATEVLSYYGDDTVATRQTRLVVSGTPLTIQYSYDPANNLILRDLVGVDCSDLPDDLPVGLVLADCGDAISYDALSRPTRLARRVGVGADDLDPNSEVVLDQYDLRGLPLVEETGALTTGSVIRRSFDRFGNPSSRLISGGLATGSSLAGLAFVFDDLDRPVNVRESSPTGDPLTGSEVGADLVWGGTARLFTRTTSGGLGIGQHQLYEAPGGRLSNMTIASAQDGTVFGGFDYGWDAPRNLKTNRQVVAGAQAFALTSGMGWSWQHDSVDRLVGAQTTADEGAGEWSFGYGVGDELLSIHEVSSGVELFTAGAEGRPEGRTTADGTMAFEYDAEGRRTADDRFLYRYDWRGELVEVEVSADAPEHAGERVRYRYDAAGRLLARTLSLADESFVEKRYFVWDGTELAAEVGVNHLDEPLWRKQYVTGAGGLDSAPQVRVERGLHTDQPDTVLYGLPRDELGSVLGVVEDAAVAPGDAPALLSRYLYAPYGEALAEAGPRPVETRFDGGLVEVAGEQQDPAVPGSTVPGGLRLVTTAPLDELSLVDGVVVEWFDQDAGGWQVMGAADLIVASNPDAETSLAVLVRAGWQVGLRYRVTFGPELEDGFGRGIELPSGEESGVVAGFMVPEDGAEPPAYARVFSYGFDSARAAANDLGGRFPGGQTVLFQGAWVDPVTGIAYHRARWYDARSSSWLGPDPFGNVDSANRYAFVAWGPHVNTDPEGEILLTTIGLAIGAGIAVNSALNDAANAIERATNENPHANMLAAGAVGAGRALAGGGGA
ncbi:MAG: RHS repeat-associated core domain-containing protein, partial [Gemmatimonadota bacterium]